MSVEREILRAEGLTKVHGGKKNRVEALTDVSFRVRAGDWVSVIGPSGSGKSTLMNLLGLLDEPTCGSYRLDGQDVSGIRGSRLARARRELIGFVFQSYNLLPRQSALENVELPMIYAGVGRRERRKRALAALDLVGLGRRAGHRPPELSGGQKQRVAVARALVNNPAVVLADEPTGNLDVASGGEILELFGELNASGVTLVLVTHDLGVAMRGGRVLQMYDGRVVADDANHPADTSQLDKTRVR